MRIYHIWDSVSLPTKAKGSNIEVDVYPQKSKMTSQVVDTASTLLAKLQSLPPEQQQQVLDFVDFLAQKYVQQDSSQKQKKRRIAGLHEGMGWMAEDFNAPLPDEFWTGKQ